MKIAVVIVTYNRLLLLQECIESIRNQSLVPDTIIIVNNGSTDGTTEWLDKQKNLSVIHQGNEGGAGGFYTGIKEAYEKGYDWIWIMDDDAFPEEKCLERLMKYKNNSKVLAPLVVEGEYIDYLHRGHFNFNRINFPLFQIPMDESSIIDKQKNILSVDFISFIGLLINREVVEKIGYPIKEYFIFNDDVEYSLRMQKNNFSKLLVLDTCIYHKINNKNEFQMKNYIGKTRVPYMREGKKDIIPIFYLYERRNSIINILMYSKRKKINQIYILMDLIMRTPLLYFRYNKFLKSVNLMWKAYFYGLQGKIDNQKLYKHYNK